MHYRDFDDAVLMVQKLGEGAFMSKTDLEAAFRQLLIRPQDWPLLVMKMKSPESGRVCYFVDLHLPFGSSMSCSIFQRFSNALAWIIQTCSGRKNINYLDDFLFADCTKRGADNQIMLFHGVCSDINLPVSIEKTEWGTTVQIFLGLLLDSINQHVGLPLEKIVKAQKIIQSILDSKKPTV